MGKLHTNVIGFDIKVENVTFARNSEIVFANTYDIMPLRFIHGDPSVMEIMFHSRNIPEPGKYKFNWSRWKDPNLDQLLETATELVRLATRHHPDVIAAQKRLHEDWLGAAYAEAVERSVEALVEAFRSGRPRALGATRRR